MKKLNLSSVPTIRHSPQHFDVLVFGDGAGNWQFISGGSTKRLLEKV